MSHKTATAVAHTIGIDAGKNTLHLIGLDDNRYLRTLIMQGARVISPQTSKLGEA
jgi:hypothetical protein